MAVKTGGRPRRGAGKGKGDARERVIAAALDVVAEGGWRSLALAAVAERAGLTLTQMHRDFPTKGAIVGAFFEIIEEAVLEGGPADLAESARDRLFDVLMRRFDALAPHKQALAGLVRGGFAEPAAACVVWPRFMRSMAWMLEAAGLSPSGLCGRLRVRGLALIHINAFWVWLDDDSGDMSRTMAALDRGLRRAEKLACLCHGLGRRSGQAEPAPAAG